MEKAAPELVARFEELVDVVAEADRKLVFGSPTSLSVATCSSVCTRRDFS